MTLDDLLRELRGNVLRDDAELASGPDDKLWSDETLVRYINEAQRRFARKTLLLRDASTPEVVEVTLATGVSTYDLHESVLAVVSGRYASDTYDLARIGRARLVQMQPVDSPYFDANSVSTLTPGVPRAFATDETLVADTSGVQMRVWPEPSASEDGTTIYLNVARLPLVKFDVNKLNEVCEIAEEYVLDMLAWAAYRALVNSDIDGHSAAADRHEQRFTMVVDEVKADIRRKMRAPIGWAFGQGGFSWGS